MNEQGRKVDLEALRAGLEQARRELRYSIPVALDTLEALLAVVDVAAGAAVIYGHATDNELYAALESLMDALEPFTEQRAPLPDEPCTPDCRECVTRGACLEPRAAAADGTGAAVADALSSTAGGRSNSLTGRDLPHISLSGPAPPPVLAEVAAERARQDAKWGGVPGVDRRSDPYYAAVLGEEFGEVCKAWLERDVVELREELVQVAAVAVAWVEELDNGGMRVRDAA